MSAASAPLALTRPAALRYAFILVADRERAGEVVGGGKG